MKGISHKALFCNKFANPFSKSIVKNGKSMTLVFVRSFYISGASDIT